MVGRRVHELRKAQGWTLATLAAHADSSETALSNIERGNRLPSLPMLDAIAEALGVEPAVFLLNPARKERHLYAVNALQADSATRKALAKLHG